MRTVITLARADLRSRWRAWLSIALLAAVAGGVVLTTTAGARRTDTAYARLLRSTRGADVEFALSGPGGSQNFGGVSRFYAAVARMHGVDLVAPTVVVSAIAPDRGNAEVVLNAGSDPGLGRAIERPKLTEGRMSDPGRVDEAVADRPLAAQLHLRVGSVLQLLARPSDPARPDLGNTIARTVRVVGVAVTRNNVVPVTTFASQGSLIVTPALLRGLNPDVFTAVAAFVRLHKGTSVAAFRRGAQALLPRYPETGGQIFVVDEHQQAGKVSHAIHPEAVALAVFALLVALTALLVIGQILVRQVFVASTDHPTLRALGLTRVQMGATGLTEVGATVSVGAVMAAAVAAALSPLMPIGPARVAEPHPGFAVNAAILGLGALAMVAAFMLRVAPSLWRLARQPGLDGAASPGGVVRPSRLLGFLAGTRAPVSATVGARLALEPGRGRTAVPVRSALAGTAVAGAAVVAAFTFGDNLVRLVNTPRLYGQGWQVSVDASFGQIPRRRADAFLRQQPRVSGWTFGNHDDVTIAGRHVAAIVITAGQGPAMFPTLLEGRPPQTPDEIVLGSKTLAGIRSRVGQTVTVALQTDSTPRTMHVVGRAVFPFFGQGETTPTGLGDGAALLDRGLNPDGFNFFLVAMVPGPAEHDDIARLAAKLRTSQVCGSGHRDCGVVTAQRPADVNNYARIESTPLALAGVLALLAVATLAHLLVTSIRRRRRDVAVLQTLGFVRHQVSAAVAWQATIVVALALLVGLPAGVAVGRGAWQFFATRLGVAPNPEVPLTSVLLSIPAALAVANAVALMPGWVAGRLRPGPVLRAE